ncbi:hypothetical protein BDV95DRAFT_487668 [Massariosphaeria phaeospora]|uniref:Short-chain dehydrogenase/reductase 3 n=1 Tax=Massariosphaeria phaeospora TaxID=100035 RepID=A0A7C8ICI0_9PLEO|nr:hypothetical protein BDV95DRAFT_487668 [Massariosphaeria phaeospora]
MILYLAFGAACLILLSNVSSSVASPKSLPISDVQYARLCSFVKWALALGLVVQVNAVLNRWAENRWLWKGDKSTWDWSSEVAIVTGGANGIGAATVKKLVARGIRVAVLDVQPISYGDLRADETSLITYYQCDITSRHAVHMAAEAIRSDLGCPSILINNAGIGNANSILEVSAERLRSIFDVNLLSHWNTVQEFLPDMIARKKGHIMSTASLASFVGLAGMVDYSCTKAGLIAFHEGLTQELKHRYNCPQIMTTIVYPNWTRTRLISAIGQGIAGMRAPIMEPSVVAEAMVKQIIARRSGQVVLGPGIAASIRSLPTWLQELIRDRMAQIVTANATTAVV